MRGSIVKGIPDSRYLVISYALFQVRIEGYTAITQVSRAENKWVKRNADVLLQLLQSGGCLPSHYFGTMCKYTFL